MKIDQAEGAGADVVSAGEIHRARAAGIPAARIVFAGVGKTVAEIEYALREGILYDLLGRLTDEDARTRTVRSMLARYGVDLDQASRVEHTALALLDQVASGFADYERTKDADSLLAVSESLIELRYVARYLEQFDEDAGEALAAVMRHAPSDHFPVQTDLTLRYF